MSLNPALAAAFAVLPEASRTVQLRGHDVTFYPIDVEAFSLLTFTDPILAKSAWGIDLETGKAISKEEVKEARDNMSTELAGKLIALSTREPEFEGLVKNFTARERSKCVNISMLITTGGDVAGFFADVSDQLQMMAALLTAKPSKPTVPAKPGKRSGKATRS